MKKIWIITLIIFILLLTFFYPKRSYEGTYDPVGDKHTTLKSCVCLGFEREGLGYRSGPEWNLCYGWLVNCSN